MCNFSKIVSLYQTEPRAVNKGSYQEWLVEHLRVFEGLNSMSEAIEEAALGKYNHQNHIGRLRRQLAADQLQGGSINPMRKRNECRLRFLNFDFSFFAIYPSILTIISMIFRRTALILRPFMPFWAYQPP